MDMCAEVLFSRGRARSVNVSLANTLEDLAGSLQFLKTSAIPYDLEEQKIGLRLSTSG